MTPEQANLTSLLQKLREVGEVTETFESTSMKTHAMRAGALTDTTKAIARGWFYLSTILDGFSRYIIAWRICTVPKTQVRTIGIMLRSVTHSRKARERPLRETPAEFAD